MLGEITQTNLEQISQILNSVEKNDSHKYKLIIYRDRSSKLNLKCLICRQNEWLSFYQYCIGSEVMKRNIDIICEMSISKNDKELIANTITIKESYTNEKVRIVTANFSSLDDRLQ